MASYQEAGGFSVPLPGSVCFPRDANAEMLTHEEHLESAEKAYSLREWLSSFSVGLFFVCVGFFPNTFNFAGSGFSILWVSILLNLLGSKYNLSFKVRENVE